MGATSHRLAVAGATMAVVGLSLWRRFLVGLGFGLAFMGLLLPWLQVIDPIAWPALSALEALFYGVGGMAAAAATRLPRWPLWVAAVWVGVEAAPGDRPVRRLPLGAARLRGRGHPGAARAWLTSGSRAPPSWWRWSERQRPGGPWRAADVRCRDVAVLGLAMALSVVAALLPQPGAPGPTEEPATAQVAAVQGNVPGIGLDAFSERRAVLDNHVEATLRARRRRSLRAGRRSPTWSSGPRTPPTSTRPAMPPCRPTSPRPPGPSACRC